MEFTNNEKLIILSVDPTDADEFLEIGMRKLQGEKLLLIVPVIPEGDKEYFNFCDINHHDETKSYNNAFITAFWLARAFPDTIVYISRDIIDERNPVSQKIYHHLSNDLPKITGFMNRNDFPLNLCLNFNELKMLINSYSIITTNVGRPCTGIIYLIDKLRLEDRIKGPIYVQGGSFWGKESGTTNFGDLFNRTERESMNLARNPSAFHKLANIVNGDICIVPTVFNKIYDLTTINKIIDKLYPLNNLNSESLAVIARENINKCLKSYYSQDRFKNGAKLFDIDLYHVSRNVDDYNKVSMSCALKKDLGEIEMHEGELDDNRDYIHFKNVSVIVSKKNIDKCESLCGIQC
mgnify:CR=1 FL=1|tara:strand:- start:6804 stop:7853 length:1050 start_codon:yes stop_codon:yes gene_type:complete